MAGLDFGLGFDGCENSEREDVKEECWVWMADGAVLELHCVLLMAVELNGCCKRHPAVAVDACNWEVLHLQRTVEKNLQQNAGVVEKNLNRALGAGLLFLVRVLQDASKKSMVAAIFRVCVEVWWWW